MHKNIRVNIAPSGARPPCRGQPRPGRPPNPVSRIPARPGEPAAHAQSGRALGCPPPLRPAGGAAVPTAGAAAPVSSWARPGRRRPPRGPRDRLRRTEGVGSRLPEAAAAAWSRGGVDSRSGNARRPEPVT